MNKLATALALIAMTAGSLAVTEGSSFAAVRHGKRQAIQKIQGTKKARKSHKRSEDVSARKTKARKSVRRHRKSVKKTGLPGTRQGTIEKSINS